MRAAICILFLVAPLFAQEKPVKLPEGIRRLPAITARTKPVGAIVFADKGRQLAAIAAAGLETWDVATAERLHTWPGAFLAIAASPDGSLIAALDDKDDVHLFDVLSHREEGKLRFTGAAVAPHDGPCDTAILSFSPNGKLLAVGCRKDIEIWYVESRTFSHRLGTGWGSRLGVVDFFPDSERIVRTGFPTYAAAIWSVKTKDNVGTLLGSKYMRSGRLAPDGSAFATGIDFGESTGVVRFLSSDGRLNLGIHVAAPVNSIAFSPDSRVVAARTIDGKLRLIHRKSLQAVDAIEVAKVAEDVRPLGLAFSPSGEYLAADEGERIVIWDVGEWRKKLAGYEKLTPERLESTWEDLSRWFEDGDEWIDVAPLRQLVGVPDQAIPLLSEKLRPASPADPAVVGRLIVELDDESFNVRERASRQLVELDLAAKTLLVDRLKKGVTLEQKRRIETILDSLGRGKNPHRLREYRAVWIACMVGSRAALELLEVWAGGAPDAFLTAEAKEALRRLKGTSRSGAFR